MKNLTLSKQVIKEGGLVILPLKEYEKIQKKITKLAERGKALTEETKVLKIIAEGENEYREGKLKSVKSLTELD